MQFWLLVWRNNQIILYVTLWSVFSSLQYESNKSFPVGECFPGKNDGDCFSGKGDEENIRIRNDSVAHNIF